MDSLTAQAQKGGTPATTPFTLYPLPFGWTEMAILKVVIFLNFINSKYCIMYELEFRGATRPLF